MNRHRVRLLLSACAGMLLAVVPTLAFQPPQPSARFDAFVIADPGAPLATTAQGLEALAPADTLRQEWERFSGANGGWQVWLDRRSGLPLLARGRGIDWAVRAGGLSSSDPLSMDKLEQLAREFFDGHRVLLGAWGGQLQLDREASGPVDDGRIWQVVFRQVVDGVAVEGARFDFQLNSGNLVAFGATRWGAVRRGATPQLDAAAARAALDAYLGADNAGVLVQLAEPQLRFLAVDPRVGPREAWNGARGEGLAHRLVWRFTFREQGAPATWIAEVDADTGQVIGFFDDTRYERVMGGVYPVSNDGDCPTGCEQPAYPMPFANITQDGGAAPPANDAGMYQCTTLGATIRTTLAGPYIRVQDNCGPVSETTTCDEPLDLRQGGGTDCTVPPGSSPGNTHSARSSFYHLNRVMQKGRAWLPDNTWLRSQVPDNLNINSTCNAFWDGNSVNFYKSGGGCRNTGEIAGVFVHEWGHGLDNYDGGGYDNPSEAYSDVVAYFETRESCIGRGFWADDHNCSGYGDACLDCSGIRDQDWNKHASHAPVTPAGFIAHNCGGGDAPCGKETHCEGYLAGQVLWDLAVRDLPANGIDQASAWQMAEKLFYLSRKGSGGPAYNCALPNGDGCGTSAWFHKLLLVDDDDGNLNNGTPHAAAIYAAFARHGIACGAPSDPANQNSSSCPQLATPIAGATPGTNSVMVSWTPVPGATSYRILRNDIGCERAQIMIDRPLAPATSYVDDDLPNNLTFYYRVQAVASNAACESPVSDCVSTAGQPFAGRVRFDGTAYGCSSAVTISVKDGNVATPTIAVTVASDSETQPETLVLQPGPPGSQMFLGTIQTTPGPAVPGDGVISVANLDVLTATYLDDDNGQGQPGLSWASVAIDCGSPVLSAVHADVTDGSALISWTTAEPASGRVEWGPTPALGASVSHAQLTTSHALSIQPFAECGVIYFRVSSTDGYGNASTLDAGGVPYRFDVPRVGGAIFRDAFETSTGWTLEGEWEIGAPQGKGNPGDPTSGFSDARVLGHDLSGLGEHPGDYENRVNERAISPVINASSLVHGQLQFRRWLNVAGGVSYVDLKRGSGWEQVWSSDPMTGVADAAWALQTIDISQYADHNGSLQIAFRQYGGPNTLHVRSGWNLDRVTVRTADAPAYEGCTACGGAPTFSGVRSVFDVDPCANTGVRLTWDAAPAWGTGSSGTYAVYRDTTPNFTPSAANRVAAGIGGTSFTDPGAPNDVTVYYLVRAENNETCSSGPANGGVTDANAIYRSVVPTTSRPNASAVQDLRAALLNQASVQLTWGTPAAASSYNVYRSPSAASGFLQVGDAAEPLYDDLGAATTADNYFYSVRPVDACGRETP
ncbi:MAG: hypothetical protein KBD01_15310 [Acidobacteria bacterium]|nr:hypothetical protein [Acidobacteriota bacterium]